MDTRRILADLRTERDRIEEAIAAVEALDRGPIQTGRRIALSDTVPTRTRRRRHMSAAARKRMSEMMKKRWAERKKKAKAA